MVTVLVLFGRDFDGSCGLQLLLVKIINSSPFKGSSCGTGTVCWWFRDKISSFGKLTVFLQSACFRRCTSLTSMDVNKRAAVKLRTGAYLSSRDQIHWSRFLSATI